jgi:hypothetical protein
MPTKAHGNSFGGGTRLFSTGDYSVALDACGSALQSIAIKGRGGAIDSGDVRVTLKGRLGTENPMATATVSLQFRDADNHQVGSRQLKLGPVSTDRTLVSRTASRVAPRGTRILVVRLQGSTTEPTCSALFDNLVVRISPV